MSIQYIKHARTASAGDSVSGSIIKITGLLNTNRSELTSGSYQTSTLDTVVWGRYTDPVSSATEYAQSEGAKITIANGDSIDGPINRFHVSGGSAPILVYFGA